MSKSNIKTSGFSLAKRKELTGDDFYEIKQFDDLTIAVLCDGVGSATQGALAAKKVTSHLINNFKNLPKVWSIEKAIKEFIKSINSILYSQSIQEYERAEYITTVTVCVIKGNRLYGANAGDSRIYLLRDDKLNQLSHDHNEEGMNSVLSNAVGICPNVEIYYFENNIQKDDKILMCSDGLYSLMNNNILSKNISNGAYQLVKNASSLVNDNLPDDTSAVILEVLDTDYIESMKNLKLEIPEKLKKGDIIDGYLLTHSLIQNNRTWICIKNTQEYVIKFAPYEAIENEEILDLYIKEVWNAKRLKAGFFPKSFVPKQRSARYYLMTKLDGINLKQYLKKRNLSIHETILLAKTLISMEEYLLKFNLVHADIKPENIIVIQRDGKRIFKIIDFGSITEIFSIASTAGTPSYLAPERFTGNAINEKTEIFSIGVTLYEALCGKYPYGEIEPFQNPTFGVAKKPQKLNNNIPAWFESVILRALSVDEDLRYSNYSYMRFELEYPEKVKPFFEKRTPLLKKDPLLFYKFGFYFLLILNFILYLKLFS
ncbi:bifunctional protein-serine/threonine kinase/phosphatase [Arcobacter caeni]|uniref:Protein kinase n=1 Tax=Arcobacter caeni TaxID=1912877 RepID=A0A363D266_9BACT|nr:bifunctional protein-serine/threonine kinase/phosphatase [Arcobacter caeni]PUE65445.1 protein kinase [Arcobacter caeni]